MIDLVGLRFGMLVVMERRGAAKNGTGTAPLWLVRCDCGVERVVRGANLRRGITASCGCRQRPHGLYRTAEYRAWVSMIQRCCNQRSQKYRHYGGRGIAVCPEWRRSFTAFFRDVGKRPGAAYSLDRWPDNNDGYRPGNVRWATATQQARSKRTSRVLVVEGRSATLAEWAQTTGIGKSTLKERLRRGWPPAKALSTPVG